MHGRMGREYAREDVRKICTGGGGTWSRGKGESMRGSRGGEYPREEVDASMDDWRVGEYAREEAGENSREEGQSLPRPEGKMIVLTR